MIKYGATIDRHGHSSGTRTRVVTKGPTLLASLLAAMMVIGCGGDRGLPSVESETYREMVSSFYAGLAAMEVSADAHAEEEFHRATELVPAEPATWANLGLLALRRNEFDVAADRLARAEDLAPRNRSIQMLWGRLESDRGRPEQAIARYTQVLALDSTDIRAMYALAQELTRLTEADVRAEEWLGRILEQVPGNAAVRIELLRLTLRRGDGARAGELLEQIRRRASSWPEEVRARLAAIEAAVSGSDFRQAATEAAMVHNLLLQEPLYQDGLAEVQIADPRVGDPIERFVRLPSPPTRPAPADTALRFETAPLVRPDSEAQIWVGAAPLGAGEEPTVFTSDGRGLQSAEGITIPFPSDVNGALHPDAVAWLDFDNDFRTDIALVGATGFRLYRQGEPGRFADVTDGTGLPSALTAGSYQAVRAADLDLEGDLDLVLAPATGPVRALRNNGDGTFTPIELFADVDGAADFAWADLDADGDPDVAFVDRAGRLQVFANERHGRFERRSLAGRTDSVLAVAVADADGDATLDLVILRHDGALHATSSVPTGSDWTVREIARWPDPPTAPSPALARLSVADLDNNGGADLIVSRSGKTRVWLRDADGTYRPLPSTLAATVYGTAGLGTAGRLDLLGLAPDGSAIRATPSGARSYGWTRLRPRAAETRGDQRINTFGIGGTVEVRAGLLYQVQSIEGPIVHFGLGDHIAADVARIVWPNGVPQAEFELGSGETILAVQRLKGSCPWVFAHDGTGMTFVTDFIWRSPLGMRINAQQTADVASTEDWIRIGGDQLVARDGRYDIRITAELWETHFFDHVSLLVVDHPEGTEIRVDERFAIPPPPLDFHQTGPARPVAGARDDRGRDVTDLVRHRDDRYLDGFGPGPYQGVTRDHYVEVELGDGVPATGPLWLVATGWIRPTDSSINVALSQGAGPLPRGLSLEVPDGRGGWRVVREDLGFPAGKEKTILIDLAGLFDASRPARLRLRTNLEIYWDRLAWAAAPPDRRVRAERLGAETAELRYRGFSVVRERDRSTPELPVYERLAGTMPRWQDLTGHYTRFGDVRELLAAIDDRYVIMNAGDELALRFTAPEPPPEGWTRDFVLIGDGWVKDGDYNTEYSATVLPLPSHASAEYTGQADRTQHDPVFRRHARDWQEYHTRYVTSREFREALVPEQR